MSRAYGFSAYGGPDTEEWIDRPVPHPGPSELVIEVKAAGVNPSDVKVRTGKFAHPDASPAFPQVLGHEAAGVVVEVGTDVTGFTAGDTVLGRTAPEQGGYAEHAVLDAAGTVHKPPQLTFVQAAALPVAGGGAHDALERTGLAAGETLLVNGAAGGVGVLLAQLARDRGATVFGIDAEAKRALVESLDAVLVPFDGGDVVERMRALLPGGVDAIVDLVGGEALRDIAILITDPARIVSLVDPDTVEKLGGSFAATGPSGLAEVADLVAEGKLDPKVLQTYPFDEAPQALRAVESGNALGNIVIDLARTTES